MNERALSQEACIESARSLTVAFLPVTSISISFRAFYQQHADQLSIL
ncbi:MAG: hypothetical protein IPL32_16455 [Chloracidobacterium sp.]|nr:hypothetical protein [Chloracidobacterium sp.]